ncbi:MAG: hypothetical protein KIS84_11210 [Dokdonella sp.]|nr:hypothetical protein [Dokdonella sp.]
MLAQVISGNPLLVTERSMTRWRLEAVEGNPDPAERMRAGGSHRRGQDPAASWPSGKARYTPAKIDPLLSDSRGEC